MGSPRKVRILTKSKIQPRPVDFKVREHGKNSHIVDAV
jgi:hypothetical protein